jgi:hypothetical protein
LFYCVLWKTIHAINNSKENSDGAALLGIKLPTFVEEAAEQVQYAEF